MKRTILPLFILSMLHPFGMFAAVGGADAAIPESEPRYLRVNVDRVVVDTAGLAQASTALAASIERLGLAIELLSTNSDALDTEQKASLTSAVKSVGEASAAVRQLAEQIPRTADALSERLPQAIRDSGQPIADMSSSLQSARDSVQLITESLPQATENAKSLVNSVLDSAMLRLSIYSFVLIGLLALAVIAVMWFVYIQYLAPLTRKLDEISGAPEQFAAIARHMEHTSANLLQLEQHAARQPPPRTGV
ncbi:MAG TPA: hypothetical protein VKB27_15840 [Gammaproteobacteria bacterium]|nr:hypothetical protein [Gammaproteobacteria bacterium]